MKNIWNQGKCILMQVELEKKEIIICGRGILERWRKYFQTLLQVEKKKIFYRSNNCEHRNRQYNN